jgi:hypothetical protein
MTIRRSIAFALTLATSLTVALVPDATAATRGSTTQTPPVIVSGSKKGPVNVSGSNVFGTVASMSLARGAWDVMAKGSLSNPGGAVRTTTCQLAAGHDVDQIQADPFGSGQAASTAGFLLNVVHVFTAAGRVNLKCASPGSTGDVKASLIRIIALKAGKLTTGTFGGTSHTTGTGRPRIISASAAGPVAVSGNNVLGTVESLRLPAGRWFVVAKLYLQNTTTGSTRVLCRLATGSDKGQTEFGLQRSGQVADRNPAGLEVAHVFSSAGAATLQCDSQSASGVQARFIRITAIQAGKLTTQAVGSGAKTTGSGIPQIISVRRDPASNVKGANNFSNVAQAKIPAGKWAFVATGSLSDITFPDATVECKIVAGADHDEAHLILTDTALVGSRDGFELEMTHVFSSPGTAALQCGSSAATSQVQIQFTKLTAIKAGTLTTAAI